MLSLYNVNARHIVAPNVVVGMAVFCGGLAQLLAGMWEFPRGNMFGATGAYFLKFIHWKACFGGGDCFDHQMV